ncbi:DUF6923 family protein [Humidisolicoccus flavus]|uniref:DUF7927 domain-containing protein n=1 Tax=Humidisolicoccus flavus TaxID=3111414 RepID=UPI00325583B1
MNKKKTAAFVAAFSIALAGLVIPQFVSSTETASAAPGDAFDPAEPAIFIAQQSPSRLHRAVTTGDGSYAFQDEGLAANSTYNAVGFNMADNYLYGIVTTVNSAFPQGSLVRIGEGNVVTRVGTQIYTHPATGAARFFSGAFNPEDGLLYASDSAPNTTMLAIDVTTGEVVNTIDFGQAPAVQDFVFKDGFAWGMNIGGDIRRLNIQTGEITVFPGAGVATAGGFGGAWNFGNGNLGFSSNGTGDVVQLQIDNGASSAPTFTIVSVTPGPGSTLNDGAAIPGLPADLTIEKSAAATFLSGETLEYEFTVSNDGLGTSSGWSIEDSLPEGVSSPVVTGDVTAQISGSDIVLSGGRLTSGESATFTITVDTDVPVGACVTNTASLIGNEDDPDLTNNTDSATSCEASTPNLTVTKSVDPGSGTTVIAGQELTYTLSFANSGTASAVIDWTDNLAGVTDDATVSQAPTSSNEALSISAVSDEGFAITGEVPAGETYTVSYSVEVRPNGDRGDNLLSNFLLPRGEAPAGACAADSELCTVNPIPEIDVVKSVEPDSGTTVAPGDKLAYTLTFANSGTAPGAVAFDDVLTDILDDATISTEPTVADPALEVSALVDGRFSVTGSLEAGRSVTVTYSVIVNDAEERGNGVLANYLVAAGAMPGEECAAASDRCTNNPVGSGEPGQTGGPTEPVETPDPTDPTGSGEPTGPTSPSQSGQPGEPSVTPVVVNAPNPSGTGSAGLPVTGQGLVGIAAILGLLLAGAGAALAMVRRRSVN